MRSRVAAAWVGLVSVLLVLFLYLPILAMAGTPSEMNEALNYVADTLLFGGAVLCVAGTFKAAKPSP
jgi:ABC-type transport system involved in multi-copper enzyme maturation permease subunit